MFDEGMDCHVNPFVRDTYMFAPATATSVFNPWAIPL
jgi:hypothetical protein